ncbi:MAG: DNA mismatch repair endonuclease MutL [Kiritimatiellae bacterium]|nr:DNA mismatch repair endonuclease MutL [Kiritimatiellia bacterium]
MARRDGHVRVLPLHVANKIAAGEVVERPASVVKELVENAIDAGAKNVKIAIVQGGRKLVSVQDDGCGMTRDDALLCLERQATSKILDVDDIEKIDTLGFRGEAIPSIASVSRFTLTTRRRDTDEGTAVQVNAGVLAEVRAAGCPPGTLVEVRDLFCNVPARRKFLKSFATEENHAKQIFTVHALANPGIGFSLSVDGRELYRLAPSESLEGRVRDLFGPAFTADLLKMDATHAQVRAHGFIEKPNLLQPTRHDQHVFVNGRPASAPAVAYALREAYPNRAGNVRPAAILFIDLPPGEVDVNVHPTKREVRFRNANDVKAAIAEAVGKAIKPQPFSKSDPEPAARPAAAVQAPPEAPPPRPAQEPVLPPPPRPAQERVLPPPPEPAPVQIEFATSPDSTASRPWIWFRYLAQTAKGFVLLETDAGLVTVNPRAARERIAYERLLDAAKDSQCPSQQLLIPETVRLSPGDSARLSSVLPALRAMGFAIEEFGRDTFKVDAVPQILDGLDARGVLATVSGDLAEAGARRGGERWREELVAKSVAKSFAGASSALTEEGAVKMVESLCSARMPYVCPRGKPTLFFISNRELNRKFALDR